MKQMAAPVLFCMVLCLLMPAHAEDAMRVLERPPIILYTAYRQAGWGDLVQIGCVDANGGIWLLAGRDKALKWPYNTADQLVYPQAAKGFERIGRLKSDELLDLQSLIESAADQGHALQPAACDAGTEYSYAVRHDEDGAARLILLGASGDSRFENTDPNAQALYAWLRKNLPEVRSFAGKPGMGPEGFVPISVRSFYGWETLDINSVQVSGVSVDCETGKKAIELDAAAQEAIRRLMIKGKVTGKANALVVTGGYTRYDFIDKARKVLASITLYRHFLVRPDGMYRFTLE